MSSAAVGVEGVAAIGRCYTALGARLVRGWSRKLLLGRVGSLEDLDLPSGTSGSGQIWVGEVGRGAVAAGTSRRGKPSPPVARLGRRRRRGRVVAVLVSSEQRVAAGADRRGGDSIVVGLAAPIAGCSAGSQGHRGDGLVAAAGLRLVASGAGLVGEHRRSPGSVRELLWPREETPWADLEGSGRELPPLEELRFAGVDPEKGKRAPEKGATSGICREDGCEECWFTIVGDRFAGRRLGDTGRRSGLKASRDDILELMREELGHGRSWCRRSGKEDAEEVEWMLGPN
ncbi:hypothetical protein MLD38_000350 [Melastoma candidum]|uniref:Uncharacterized protein n=1 Tax=Melastoma candidum TaxID=119954 RepID=A0ACB9SBC9_9MYRT|nr:hypothetical protein MLD38_000350 [Melastoma candidum]